MQKPIPIGQSGSILAGCIILCLVLTTGAAGLLMVTGAWTSSVSASVDRTRLLNAAETGMVMGVRWLRGAMTPGNQAGFTGVTPVTDGSIEIEGATTTVVLEHDEVANIHHLVATATFDGCRQAEIRWQVISVNPAEVNDGLEDLSKITFANWRETFSSCGG